MRRPASFSMVGVLSAAASVAAVGAGSGVIFRGGYDCHQSFPTFLWTGSKAGEHWQSGYQHLSTDAHEVAAMVVDAASAANQLEAVVVVLSQGGSFSTSGVSEANAKAGASLHAKSATATFPYTYPAESTLRTALPLMAAVTGAPVQELSLAEVIPTAVETGMLGDGKLDFVIVTVEENASVQETDAALRQVTASLEQASNGKFVLLWTGDLNAAGCGRRSLAAEAATHRRLQTDSTVSRTIKITPDILAGVLTLILFLFILYMGLSCVGDIECPRSFATVKPASGREY